MCGCRCTEADGHSAWYVQQSLRPIPKPVAVSLQIVDTWILVDTASPVIGVESTSERTSAVYMLVSVGLANIPVLQWASRLNILLRGVEGDEISKDEASKSKNLAPGMIF